MGQLGEETLVTERLVLVVGIGGERQDADAAAWIEDARHLDVAGIHQFDQVLHNDVHAVLMEIAVVAEREQVQLERLGLHHPFARDVGNHNPSEIRLPRLRAQGGELGTVQSDNIFVVRMLVDERFQERRVITAAVNRFLIAQKGDAFQFVFAAHNVCVR